MLATYGPIITRRRVKCGVKVLLIVGLLVAYVTVLLRESLQAMDATKRKEVVRQLAGEWKVRWHDFLYIFILCFFVVGT